MLYPAILIYLLFSSCCCSVAQSCLTQSLWLHGLQHARLPCPSPSPGVCSNSSSQWCHLTISSSVVPFSSCVQFFSSIRLFSWVGSSHQVAKVLELQLHHQSFHWFPSGLTGLISLLSKRLSSLLQHHSLKASILQCSAIFIIQLSHPYMTTGKIMHAC